MSRHVSREIAETLPSVVTDKKLAWIFHREKRTRQDLWKFIRYTPTRYIDTILRDSSVLIL